MSETINHTTIPGALKFNDGSPLCICDTETESHHHECPRATGDDDLESVASIAERTFPKEVAELRQHIDSDRHRKNLWDQECQESGRLNK